MTTQHDIPTWEELEDRLDRIEGTVLEIRIRNLEASLRTRNEATERVLEACRRITSAWNTPVRKGQDDDTA